MRNKNILSILLLAAVGILPAALSATDYKIYIHGFANDDKPACWNATTCPDRWNVQQAGNVRHVTYNGWMDPVVWSSDRGAYRLFGTLNTYCRTGNRCIIVCHSMGCLTTGYVLDKWGSSFNVIRVAALAAAEGGSELANVGSGITLMSGILGIVAIQSWMSAVPRLTTAGARGVYDHNDNGGALFYHTAGYKTGVGSILLPGEDDNVVAYHSACGMRDIKGYEKDQCGTFTGRTCWLCSKKTYYAWNAHYRYREINEYHIPIKHTLANQNPSSF